MGGHTIGKATKANVGFQGQWTGPDPMAKFQFDGTYHHIMLVHDYGWTLQVRICILYISLTNNLWIEPWH